MSGRDKPPQGFPDWSAFWRANGRKAAQASREARFALQAKAALLDAVAPVVRAAIDLAPLIRTMSVRMDGNHTYMTGQGASEQLGALRHAAEALKPEVRAALDRLASAQGTKENPRG